MRIRKMNKMERKDYMLGFLKQEANTTFVEEVIDVKAKEDDDEYGAAGQHYIVTVKIRVPDFHFTTSDQTKIVDAKCLVNVRQFNDFVEKHKAIIWL